MQGVTNFHVKRNDERQKDQLADLVVLNERLSGAPQPWNTRQRLEYLRTRRQQWERVYEHLTKTDAAATLASIEEAAAKVGWAASEHGNYSKSSESAAFPNSNFGCIAVHTNSHV